MTRETAADQARRNGYRQFLLRVLIVVGVVALALLLWRIRDAFLLFFASIIIAILLSTAADPIRKRTSLSRKWSLGIAGSIILLALALFAWLVGAQLQGQIAELSGRLPQAVENFEQQIGISVPVDMDPDAGRQEQGAQANGFGSFSLFDDLLIQAASWARTVLAAVAGLILVVIGGVFLAANPRIYRQGLVKLFPRGQHERAEATLTDCGRALYYWILGQLLAMTIIGVLAGLGTWAIGLQAPLALGFFAGLTEFVPIIGPIVGAIPALLLALTQGTGTFLWTLALYIAIQQLESNVITPLVEKRMVHVPPALFLFSVLAFGLLFGILGVLVAGPLTVVAYVAVKKLYVRETLSEPTEIPGEN